MTSMITVENAKKNFISVVDQVNKGKTFFVKSSNTAMVPLKLLLNMVKHLETHDPGLADTVAISSNRDIQVLLEQSIKEMNSGDVVPFNE